MKPSDILNKAGANISRTTHAFSSRPTKNGYYFGPSGCGPCVGVVIVCGKGLALFHFDVQDDAAATIKQYDWTNAGIIEAAICGGDDEWMSRFLMEEVVRTLLQIGIPKNSIGYSNSSSLLIGYKPNGAKGMILSTLAAFKYK